MQPASTVELRRPANRSQPRLLLVLQRAIQTYAAFGWRSASSASIKTLLTLRALAPEVPKEIISSKPTFTSRKYF